MANSPSAPTITVAFTTGLDVPTPVLVCNAAGASVTQPAVAQFPVAGFTFTCWLCTTQTTAGSVLVSYDAASASNRFWIKSPSSLEIGIGTQSTGATGVSFADNAWHYLAVTVAPYGAGTYTVALYKDGVLVWSGRSAIRNAAAVQTGGDFVLGQGIASEPAFAGQLSEARLLNVVQAPNDVMTGMQIRMSAQDPTAVIVWALTSAQTAGQLAGSYSFSASQPALQFRINRSLPATFTSAGAGATYAVAWTSSDGVYHAPMTGLPLAPVTFPAPLMNVTYSAVVQATLGGSSSPWSTPASVLTLDLGQPQCVISQGPAGQVSLAWAPCDQATQYSLLFYKDGSTTPGIPSGSTAGTSFDLTSVVLAIGAYTYTVAATSGAATGPVSPIVPASAPALTFTYDWEAGSLTANWPATDGASFHYLTIDLSGTSGNLVATLLPASTQSYVVATPVTQGQSYTAQARSLQTGTISAWSPPVTVVIQQIPGPVISSISGDSAAHTITATWTAAGSTPAGATFSAELWSGDGQTRLAQVLPAVSPQVFTNAAIVDGASFEVRVRAVAGNSYGKWSAWAPITINGVPKVVGVTARSDASGNITVTWSPVTGFSGVTYTATITGSGVTYTSSATSDTSVQLSASATHVQLGQTYQVTVQASAPGHSAGPASDPVSVTTQQNTHPTGPSGTSSDPIDVASGALLYQNDEIAIGGVLTLTFTIFYSSNTPIAAENPLFAGLPLGNRWSHSFNTRLVRDPSGASIYVFWGQGGIEVFAVPASVTGLYPNTGAALGETLVLGADLYFTLTRTDQTRYRFDNSGALVSITDKYGRQIALAYASGQLQTVTDVASGRALTLNYSGSYLQNVQDATGRSVVFGYDGADLQHVTDAMGNTRTFNYTGASLLQTLVDARGNTAFKNTYTSGRVTFQQDARALAAGATYGTTFTYQNVTVSGVAQIQTTVVDRMNNTIIYTSLASNHALLSTQWNLANGTIQVESATYDAFNNVLTRTVYLGPAQSWTAGAGNTTTYTYDGNGNLLTTTVPLANGNARVTTNTYDGANNRRTQRVYEGAASGYSPTAGNLTTWVYNGDNTLQTIIDPLGRTIQMTYWPGAIAGLLQTMTDALGNVFNFVFTGGVLQTVTNPYGQTVAYQFDGVGRATQTTYADSSGTILKTTLAAYYANSLKKTWSAWMTNQPVADAFVTAYLYDNNGNLQTLTDASGTVLTLVNDPNNLPTSATWPTWRGSARTIGYQYDNNDDLHTVTYAPGIVDTYTYDSLQRTLTYLDPNQNLYQYARAMNLTGSAPYSRVETTTWPPLALAPGVTYTDGVTLDPLGRVIAVQDRNGNVVNVDYTTQADATTKTLQTVQTITLPPAQSGATRYTITRVYDAVGRLISVQDQNGATTTVAWSVGTPASAPHTCVRTQTDPLGNQIISSYDSMGREIERTRGLSPLLRSTSWAFDTIGRILSVTQTQSTAATQTTYSYAWDSTNKYVTASIGRPGVATGATLQSYNGLNQLVTQGDGSGAQTSRTYAPWGSLASYTNGRNQTCVYNFDPAGRLATIQLPDNTIITQTCDANGNRKTTLIGAQTAVTRTFDEWNRLQTRIDAVTGTIGYQWWPTGQMKTLTYTDQKEVQYVIDGLQRLYTVTDWAARVTTYSYQPTGEVSGIAFPNGATAAYRFDGAGRYTGFTHTAGGLVVAQLDVVPDALGQPNTDTALLPLPPAFPASNQAFTYTVGNQIATANGVQQAYDADGDWTGVQGQQPEVTYDAYGRVTDAQIGRHDQYNYDPDGLRTQVTLGGVAYHYVYDVNGFSSPQVERGDPTRATVYAQWLPTSNGDLAVLPITRSALDSPQPIPTAIDRVLEIRDANQVIQQRIVHGLGALLQEDASGSYHVFHDDQVGSILALTNNSGVITDRYNYDPYGQSFGQDGSTPSIFHYGGRDGVIDDGAGLLYARSRSYSPTQMRWLQPDYFLGSAAWPQTLNSYSFVMGNPLQFADPLGLARTAGIVVGVLGGAAVLGGLIYAGVQSGAFGAALTWAAGLFGSGAAAGEGLEIPLLEFPAEGGLPAEGEVTPPQSPGAEEPGTPPPEESPPASNNPLLEQIGPRVWRTPYGSQLTQRLVSSPAGNVGAAEGSSAFGRISGTLDSW